MKVLLKTLKGQIQPGTILLKQGAFMAWFHSLKMTRESTSLMSTALYEQQQLKAPHTPWKILMTGV